jgi:hypothetical protein
MRVHRFVIVVICCALAIGCGGSSVERPATASVAPPVVAPSRAAAKPPKRVATSAISASVEIGSTDGSFDVDSLNPVKMDRNAASGSGFNPFAK